MNVNAVLILILGLPLLSLAGAAVPALHPPAAATASASKGPIQLTLRLYKTSVKRDKSLWYQIELKNTGKEKILVSDKIFRDPWAMHENIFYRRGIYLDLTAPPGRYLDATWPPRKRDGKSPQLRTGAATVRYEYAEKKGVSPEEGRAVNEKLAKLEAKWKKEDLPQTQRTIARHRFWSQWNREKMEEEDRAKTFWLAPGASTTTLAWAYWDPDPYATHTGKDANVEDEEPQVGNYAQLWSYKLFYSGRYKIRAVYDHGVSEEERELDQKYGGTTSSWRVEVRTPYIAIEVLP